MTVKHHEEYYRAQLKARAADGGSGAGTPLGFVLVKDRSRAQKTEGTREWAELTMNNYIAKTRPARRHEAGRP